MHWVYAVYNKQHNKIYIDETVDLEERIEAHNDGRFKNSYTSRFGGEWELIYKESVTNRSEALKREKQLKSYRGREFIKQHIPG